MTDADLEKVEEDDLRYEPFVAETLQVRNFDSGEPDLDDFLNTDEVEKYQAQKLGVTTLVYYKGEIVGFFTTASADLKTEKLKVKKGKVYVKTRELNVASIPALMIGRFAVQKKWQGKGVGRFMLRHIVGLAFDMQQYQGLRLLVLNAKPGSVGFYQRMGFDFTDDRAEKNKRNKTMFLDLEAIEDVA